MVLDTHIWLRWLAVGSQPLPPVTVEHIEQAETIVISAISIWEAAQLHKRGRISLGMDWAEWLSLAVAGANVMVLPITETIAARAAFLPEHHRDPADRLIIATAVEYKLPLLSFDEQFASYRELDGLLIK
ncbi:MAG: type II toxin-antitoxin system VapC family toxin [Candidatus Competibacteraceae bacterium]